MAATAFSYAHSFAQTHSITFLSDNLRNTLREVIRENGLSPEKLMQDWETIENGIRTWLYSRHLMTIVVEFFQPQASFASARWEFPISYSGSGVDDDMWLDNSYLRQLIAKSSRPTSNCTYRVIFCTKPGAPTVAGMSDCSFLSTGQMAARQAGTVIATPHLTAGVTYWR
jgi:Bacterial HORMA domain 2